MWYSLMYTSTLSKNSKINEVTGKKRYHWYVGCSVENNDFLYRILFLPFLTFVAKPSPVQFFYIGLITFWTWGDLEISIHIISGLRQKFYKPGCLAHLSKSSNSRSLLLGGYPKLSFQTGILRVIKPIQVSWNNFSQRSNFWNLKRRKTCKSDLVGQNKVPKLRTQAAVKTFVGIFVGITKNFIFFILWYQHVAGQLDSLPLKKSKKDWKRPIPLDFSDIGLSRLSGFYSHQRQEHVWHRQSRVFRKRQAGAGHSHFVCQI